MFKDTKFAISLAGVYEAGSHWRVSVAGSHGPAKPAFCRYRQGKLVIIIIIWFGDTVTVMHFTKCNTNSKVRTLSA